MIDLVSSNSPNEPADAPPPSFGNKELLHEHVEKHVLDNKAERWTELLSDFNLTEERRNEAISDDLALEYESIASNTLLQWTKTGKNHQHLYRYEAVEDELLPTQEFIHLWCPEKHIFLVASAVLVRNHHPSRYRLRTAYRVHLKATGKEFVRKIKRDNLNRMQSHVLTLVSDHSGDVA
jgi:hypothetical protein